MSFEDKINISVPYEVKQRLEEDASLFEVFKKDGETINRNDFINRLIYGYYTKYVEQQSEIAKDIFDVVLDEQLTAEVLDVLDKHRKREYLSGRDTHAQIISLKPTRKTKGIIHKIAQSTTATHSESVAVTLKKMFISYLAEPLYMRERYIFKDTYETVKTACREGLQISIRLRHSMDIEHSVLPYRVSVGEERSNYLLCQEWNDYLNKDVPCTFRISRIMSVIPERKTMTFSKRVVANLDKMADRSPAYPISRDSLIRVRMSPDAEALYKKIVFNRPRYTERDGNIYTFDCSFSQAYQYFSRLPGVTILEPESLSKRLIEFHKNALESLDI